MKKKDVLISIKGIQNVDGDEDIVDLFTTGSFYESRGVYFISYDEAQGAGFGNVKTTVKVEADRRVTLSRSGHNDEQLIVENGVRRQSHYWIGENSIMMGVSGISIESGLNENGGRVNFKYSIDFNTSLASVNQVIIDVKEND